MRILATALLLIPMCANASGLVLSDVWSRATPPGARAAAIYGVLENDSGSPVTIGAIETPVAGMAHLHMTSMEDGMMRMRQSDDIVLAPGERLVLEPGGFHIMLMGLKQGLSEGEMIDLRVSTTSGAVAEVQVPVGSIAQMGPP